MTAVSVDMFADPSTSDSETPSDQRPAIASFRGRLVMMTCHSIESRPSRMNPGQMEDTATVDVVVVDGKGALPLFKEGNPTGGFTSLTEFRRMWISSSFLVSQLRPYTGTGRPLLGVIDTKTPGTQAGRGNPWGLIPATAEQKQQAVNYLNSRAVNGSAAPTPAPAVKVPAPTSAPVDGPTVGVNPFA